jgi:rhamnose utilization protein RhaD (predicted bifunctional aldolase and dehydrogenase)
MESLWDPAQAERCSDELELRAYSSRLLGREPALVLHGGGNTSVKLTERNLFGDEEDILYVKGSGRDLATIDREGFSPCRLAYLRRLADLDHLPDLEMSRQLRISLIDPLGPDPSVEAILHALIPHRYVDHTHADAVLAVTNTPEGEARVGEIYGDEVVVVPYVMPGFELARICSASLQDEFDEQTIGIVLLHHGIFSFGEDARESYERMIELVARAEKYLVRRGSRGSSVPEATSSHHGRRVALAELRARLSTAAEFPLVVTSNPSPECLAFARRGDVAVISQQGPATPDHVARTKRVPLVGRDVEGYAEEYRRYFERHSDGSLRMLDPAPRIVLDPELGLCAAGRSAAEALIAAEIYLRTIDVILSATALSRFEALPENEIFAVEYWDLEQAKLRRQGPPAVFAGEIALVTGAASGIGRATAEALLARGAAVAGLDIDPAIEQLPKGAAFLGLRCDVTRREEVERALDH